MNRLGRSSHQTTADGNVYYNIEIPNNSSLAPSPPATVASFFEVRSTPVITGNPREYTLSVVRAKIPTSTVPLKIMEIVPQPYNTDVNETVYSVTLSWGAFDAHHHIMWVTQDAHASVPVASAIIPPSTSLVNPQYVEYYSCYSVQHFINLVNVALAAAAAELVTHGAPSTFPPFLFLNPISNRIALYADTNYSSTGTISIYMNNYLSNNFGSSFDTIYQGTVNPNDKNVKYLVYDIEGKNTETIGGHAYYVMTQEYNTKSNMSSFTSLVFASSSIPARSELISKQVQNGNPSTSGFFRILQDLEIDSIPNDVSFNAITYNPTAEFRRMTLVSDNQDDLRTVDIQIYWKDNYDNLYPLYILPGEIATIKFLFEKILV